MPWRALSPMDEKVRFIEAFRSGFFKFAMLCAFFDFSRKSGYTGVGGRAEQGRVEPLFERAFQEYGLPDVIRTDNGAPFASQAIHRLSRLHVWWIKIGVYPELILPGHPQQNGRHERFHKTLKEGTARPPASSPKAQQGRFNRFVREYNEERPHEALGQEPPASVYRASFRPYPERIPELESPAHFERRLGGRQGGGRGGGGG